MHMEYLFSKGYIFVLISNLNPYSQGRAGTTSMGVKGMLIDRCEYQMCSAARSARGS